MKLIFLDVDGTLTRAGENVPPDSALDALRRAREAGHRIFLCSGRNRAMLAPLLRYGFDGYIASAGGYVVCGEEVLFDCPMADEQRDTALRLMKENGVLRTVEARDASYCDPGIAELMGRTSGGNSELIRWRRALEAELNLRPMAEYDGRPVYKLVFVCESERQLAPVRAALEAEFNFVVQEAFSRGCVNGELINRKFDKGRGVRRIAEALGVPLADTVAFGDSMNDLELIRTADTGVCMANGCAALKRESDLVCPAVDEDGVARAFAQLGLVC